MALPPTGGKRVLVFGDTAGTGFGTVTRDLCTALVKRGVDVRLVTMNEEGNYNSDPQFPKDLLARVVMLGSQHGWQDLTNSKAAGQLLIRAVGLFAGATIPGWKPEVCLFIGDHSSIEQTRWLDLLAPTMPAFCYVPIEGIDLPPLWAKLWSRVKPIAMTHFGARQIEIVTGELPPVVYHGVDPTAFWKVSAARPLVIRMPKGLLRLTSREDCRRFLGWERNSTILFRADRLMQRKAYPAMFRALAPVMAAHDEVRLVLHCRTVDQGGNLWHEASKYPEFIRQRIDSTRLLDGSEAGAPREILMAMYNAADIYISTGAEGFGLTVAEALACGIPAVALGYSSLPEVVGPAGILVEEFALIDNIYSYFWAIPKGEGYSRAVESLVVDKAERERLGALGPGHIAQFTWEAAAEQIEAILTDAPVPERPAVSPSQRMAALGLVEVR
jgi:glycosyltransferase involved in cell wall biosynthesis